ncbi:hypothetical protein DFP72DRAFT_1073357 [Ephemerocybe angulata]|uniref:Uncharacterized protein n=1 Tax=Ephemerocybe angulata TaxID=980116 RepID=A0A8H6HN43_9AGAR|nr:hypothetical protein DFP72DRAFT_1073355 [Tulosesus angulatus]KAF6749232.1 hypothetical protein DFP72DRAFT_1073357 [Tulosesus angulatus]
MRSQSVAPHFLLYPINLSPHFQDTFDCYNTLNQVPDAPAHTIEGPDIILTPISGIRYVVSTPTSLTTTYQCTPAPTSPLVTSPSRPPKPVLRKEIHCVEAIQAHHDVPLHHVYPPIISSAPAPRPRSPKIDTLSEDAIRTCHDVLPDLEYPPILRRTTWPCGFTTPFPGNRYVVSRPVTVHDVDHSAIAQCAHGWDVIPKSQGLARPLVDVGRQRHAT